MNLSHLRYFVELAHTRHYTRAAEHLFITQPSLSHAIGQLESELGVPLFERSGRNTTLTRLGEEFLVCAERTLSTLDSGVESLRRSAQGEGLIRLGLVRPLGVDFIPDLAARFVAENSGKEIHFTFGTGVTQQLLDGLLARRYDLVFSSMPPAELGLSARPVVRQDLVLVVPPDHPLAGRKSIDLEETLSYPYVSFSRGSGMRDTVDALFGQLQARPRISCETEEMEVVAGLAARGFGIAVVPRMDLLDQLPLKVISIPRLGEEHLHGQRRADLPLSCGPQLPAVRAGAAGRGDGDRAEMLIDSLHGRPRQNEASRAPFLLISRRPAGSRRWSAGEPGKRRKRTIWGP